MEFSFNLVPVLIISVLLMPLGAFIYSQKGLGNQWLKAIGKTMEEIQAENNNMALYMGGAFVSSFVTTYLIGVVIYSLEAFTVVNLALLILVLYLIVFLIRLKGSLFDGNFPLFKVNLIGTGLEFVVTFLVFMVFML